MAEKKITRKVISKGVAVKKTEETEQPADLQKTTEEGKPKKACFFCQSKTDPSYTDVAVLRRFLSDRAKIVSRAKNSLCSKHQRGAGRQIKYARHLALLPFTPRV
ncbi:30S ribosomal protein S18 [Candidatus Daviesbacteria bacterium]|nr:30S ribosomal protein S18 [Candidatus Daviesbacteria bacterium]